MSKRCFIVDKHTIEFRTNNLQFSTINTNPVAKGKRRKGTNRSHNANQNDQSSIQFTPNEMTLSWKGEDDAGRMLGQHANGGLRLLHQLNTTHVHADIHRDFILESRTEAVQLHATNGDIHVKSLNGQVEVNSYDDLIVTSDQGIELASKSVLFTHLTLPSGHRTSEHIRHGKQGNEPENLDDPIAYQVRALSEKFKEQYDLISFLAVLMHQRTIVCRRRGLPLSGGWSCLPRMRHNSCSSYISS